MFSVQFYHVTNSAIPLLCENYTKNVYMKHKSMAFRKIANEIVGESH